MTTEEFLLQARSKKRSVVFLEELLALQKSNAIKCRKNETNAPNHLEKKVSFTEEAAVLISNTEEKLSSKKREYDQIFTCILNVIQALPDETKRMILIRYYLYEQTWNTIAEETGYSLRHIYRLRKEALSQIALPEEITGIKNN